ncbi:MAG TPA: hypothetical protein VFG21_05665 [Xanthomonadaceae bacterium]|nr:hypothetical protein [Xanthomonadaceae bacterium]
MSNMAIYLIGTVLVVIGLAYGAHLLGIAGQWIAVGAIVVIGIGVLSGVAKTRTREEPPPSED